ncbi:STAS domain-containing protein [Streptomyces sp. NPDC127084]|uniref:STAS domain-containing protein n=1 Tax=Streptomyces sp. NPDC127084 TaxID=3347133 RepID=UPI00365B34D0
MQDFHVTVSHLPKRMVVTLQGELDIDTCPYVTHAIAPLALHNSTLTLDMSEVSFMDSSSLTMLLRLRQRSDVEGFLLELSGLPEQGRRVMELTGALPLFRMRSPELPAPRTAPEDHHASDAVRTVRPSAARDSR